MSTNVAPVFTMEQLETAILADVVIRFINLHESTSRFSLLVKFEGQPVWQAISSLSSRNVLRNAALNKATEEEEYLPRAAAFEFCGILDVRNRAKSAATIVLHTLKQMFKGEPKTHGLTLGDLQRHVNDLFPNNKFDLADLKLGLYLASDFRVLTPQNSPDPKDASSFRITETAISMPNPDTEWDRVMAAYRWTASMVEEPVESEAQWEEIRPLGGGGQSDVFLVRSPPRVRERMACLRVIRTALAEDKRAALADAVTLYSRPDTPAELGAKKGIQDST